MEGETRPAVAAGLTSVTLWASAFVGIRAAGRYFAPGPLAAGRLLIGSVVLGLIVAIRREPLPRRRSVPLIGVCGLLWFALYNVCLNAAERRLDPGTASMIVRVGPILIAVLAGLLLDEGFSRWTFIGGAVALLGTGVIALGSSGGGGSASLGGVALCLLAAVAYAGGVVAEKVVLRSVGSLPTVFCCCLVGALACSPFLYGFFGELGAAPDGGVVWLLYLGVFPTAVGFTTWAWALARTEAGRLGALVYLGPPISILLSWLLLGEVPPALGLLGGAIALVGVAVSGRRPRTPRAPARRPRVPGRHGLRPSPSRHR